MSIKPKSKPVFVGIDASSTRLAVVILHHDWQTGEEITEFHTVKLPKIADAPRCIYAREWIQDMLYLSTPALVGIEAPFVHRLNANGSVGVIQVNGAVLAGTEGWESLSVQPSKWKAALGMKGNAKKDEIDDWVRENHYSLYLRAVVACEPDTPGTKAEREARLTDILDAYCVALYTRNVYGLRKRMANRNTIIRH